MILDRLKNKWDTEYQEKGIPSSFRKGGSSGLVWALSQIDADKNNWSVIDVGCGCGRNSLYLADQGMRVIGFDISDVAIRDAEKAARESGLEINFLTQPVQNGLPAADQTQDLVTDIYTGFHVGSAADRQALRKEINRVLKPEGYLVLATVAYDDGYYGLMPTLQSFGRAKLVHDAAADVPIMLYDAQMLINDMADFFEPVAFYNERKTGPMYGKEYSRSNLLAVFRPRQQEV